MARNKPRKWANQKGRLPEEQVELSDHMVKVFEAKDARATMTMQELQNEWVDLEEEDAFAELAQSERNIKYEALERRILEELEKVKAVAGTDMWRGEFKTFSPQFALRPVVDDPGKLMQWIKDTGQESQLTLPAPRLKSIVGEAMDTDGAAAMTPAQRTLLKPGDPSSGLPPPGVSVFLQNKVHHTTVKQSPLPDDPF